MTNKPQKKQVGILIQWTFITFSGQNPKKEESSCLLWLVLYMYVRIHVNDGPCKSCWHVRACAAPKTRLPERGKSTGAVCVCVCICLVRYSFSTSYSWRHFCERCIATVDVGSLTQSGPEWIVSLCALRDTLKQQQQHQKVECIIEWHIGCDASCFVIVIVLFLTELLFERVRWVYFPQQFSFVSLYSSCT